MNGTRTTGGQGRGWRVEGNEEERNESGRWGVCCNVCMDV